MKLANMDFVVQPSVDDAEEITSEDEPDVRKLTHRNAMIKLTAAMDTAQNRIAGNVAFIAADTLVSLDGTALGKPHDQQTAIRMLNDLRGRQHEVFTSVAMTYSPPRDHREVSARTVVSTVQMRDYTDHEIHDYVSSGTPYDRAGGYGIQDRDFAPVRSVFGCYLNIVGLPLCAVRAMIPNDAATFAETHIYATCGAHEEQSTP